MKNVDHSNNRNVSVFIHWYLINLQVYNLLCSIPKPKLFWKQKQLYNLAGNKTWCELIWGYLSSFLLYFTEYDIMCFIAEIVIGLIIGYSPGLSWECYVIYGVCTLNILISKNSEYQNISAPKDLEKKLLTCSYY